MLILDIPFEEKDEAKKLGARWNPEIKKWFVKSRDDYYKFERWILPYGNIIVCDAIYILEGKKKCSKCKEDTKVIGIGIENHIWMEFINDEEYRKELKSLSRQINIVWPVIKLPMPILKYIQDNYNYKSSSKRNAQSGHLINYCDYCDSKKRDWALFEEVNSPFFIDSIEKVKDLKIYKISLTSDMIMEANIEYDPDNWMLKKYGNIIPLDIEC